MKTALDVGGAQNAEQLGRDLGALIWQVGSVVTGAGGLAKGGVWLAKAGVKVATAGLETMASLAKFEGTIAKGGIFAADGRPLVDLSNLTAEQLNNFYRDGASSDLVVKAYAQAATSSTKNAGSAEVVLGKYKKGNPTSYDEVARSRGATYFSMDDWGVVESQLGAENMWSVNKAFLEQQIMQGKSFVFVDNPALADGYLLKEVNFLKSQGYSFKLEKGVYRAIK